MDDEAGLGHDDSWAEFESLPQSTSSTVDLSALPESVREIVEQCRAEVAAESAIVSQLDKDNNTRSDLPYTCRLYDSVPGEEDLLQLQWMRIDMSQMDSNSCWGHPDDTDNEVYEDCSVGPDSGLVVPSMYRVELGQLFPLPLVSIGLVDDSRIRKRSDPDYLPATAGELSEHSLCTLGRNVTDALSGNCDGSDCLASSQVLKTASSLPPSDLAKCFENYVPVSKCDASRLEQFLSWCPHLPFECMVNHVLTPVVGASCARRAQGEGDERDIRPSSDFEKCNRDEAAIRMLCQRAASAAVAGNEDPVRFRDRVSASGMRSFGKIGRDAELHLAEKFFEALRR